MSTVARPRPVTLSFQASRWTPWTILAVDVFALHTALALGFALRWVLSPWLPASIGFEQYLGVGVATLLLPAVNYQIGLYPGYLLGPVERLRRRTLSTLAVFGGLAAWDSIVARGVLSRGVLLATFVFALVLPPLADTLARHVFVRRRRWGIPVVMIGAGATGRALARLLLREPQVGLVPIAFLDNNAELWGELVEGVPVAGPLDLAPDLETKAEAAIVCLADGNRDAANLLQELNFPRLFVMADIPGIASLWVSARDLGGCLGLEVKKNLLVRRNHVLKRWMDRAVALPLFLASLPIVAVSALWIKLASRGPAFFRQVREGLSRRSIHVTKLRTMHLNSDGLLERWLETHPEDRAHWRRYFKLRHDPRVLRGIGRLLRRTSLDELPQLWSVLKGEMSLVGPRPLPGYHLDQLSPEFRALRGRVLPGLTGLWQVSARGDGNLDVLEALDTYYIRNWSLWLDLYILIRTVAAVALARGAY